MTRLRTLVRLAIAAILAVLALLTLADERQPEPEPFDEPWGDA